MKPKKLKLRYRANGNIEIYCPYCKQVIFAGFSEGFTYYSLEGKCLYCNKEIDEKWEDEK